MKKVTIDDVDNQVNPMQVHSVRRPVSSALGTTDFAMNYFELEAGESFSGGLHTHHDQEEVFYVEEGTATFETLDEEITVEAGEIIRFAPGEWQKGYNDGSETVIGWALGAPGAQHDWDELESMVYCQECETEVGHGTRLNDDMLFELSCTECGNSFTLG